MARAGEFFKPKVVPISERLGLLMNVLHDLKVSLVVDFQHIVILDTRRELHAIGHVIKLLLVNSKLC